jgi:hypothetical protein
MKTHKIHKALIFVSTILSILIIGGCKDSYLNPNPLSIMVPDNVFTDAKGFEGALLACRKQIKLEYYYENKINATEYFFTDIAVNGNPEGDRPHNMDLHIGPTGVGEARIFVLWDHCYLSINYANIIVSRIDNATWKSENEKNVVLSEAYFHRAYWYYRLVHCFGDVPWVGQEVTTPKLDFQTYSREAILQKIKRDLEFAVQYLPDNVQFGKVNKAAGNFLLTKVYLSLREFDKAIEASSAIINDGKHALMKSRFGQGLYANNPKFNVIWDLHQRANKSIVANKEGILVVQDKYGFEGCEQGTWAMRDFTPMWHWSVVKAPNGKIGTVDDYKANARAQAYCDSLGRGLGRVRPSSYGSTTIWNKCGNDYRHSEECWFSRDEFIFNNPACGEWFMKKIPISHMNNVLKLDTIRTIYAFPYYKLFIPDELRTIRKPGGNSDWYVFRVAEVYLLRAEAYYWQNKLALAADDINQVRGRANAPLINANEVSIDYIFDERARELYAEEPRKTEMTRVAYIMAMQNKDGYSFANMSTKNWYYDRVMKCNTFFSLNIMHVTNFYKISPFHVYWPIPQSAIDANSLGIINQNAGYISNGKSMIPITQIE